MLLLATTGWACPPLDDAIERLTQAIVNQVDPSLPRADIADSLACAPASPTSLSHLYLAEGASAWLAGDPTAKRWFAAARRLAPEDYDSRFGSEIHEAWGRATPDGSGTLTVDIDATVDGVLTRSWPIPVLGGPAVVQVIGRNDTVRYGRLVEVAPGENLLVQTTLGPERAPLDLQRKRSPVLAVAAGTAAVLGAAAAGGAVWMNDAMGRAPDVVELNRARSAQQALGYSAYALGGIAVVGAGFWIALP